MPRRYTKLEDLPAYNQSAELADYVWEVVVVWDWFAKKTVGSQFVESTDSTPANIAEGFGRYHKKDKIKFYLNARGSVYEAANWCKRAIRRSLLSEEQSQKILANLRELPREINYLIKITRDNLSE